ncbi:hypothetical protein L1987_46125 [Smallanthus sonchifolius]|uniref:Uncharacterized protein n=1 Tax=Smallanthus sonchifolius TaxID=185202 RepID=A0ACB9FYQ9_9ASTR|nr:hypothetical protein L1987_46125 [Smallanthus sonchifolius]
MLGLFSVEKDTHFLYLVMQFCSRNIYGFVTTKDVCLALWLESGYRNAQLFKLIRDIVVGVKELHVENIIHGDLNSQNIFVVNERRILVKLSGMTIKSHHAFSKGTPVWRAPELIREMEQTKATNMFSLGCVIYYCLTCDDHLFGDHFE